MEEPSPVRAHWAFAAFFTGLAGYYLCTLAVTALTADRFDSFDISDPPVLGPLLLLLFLPNILLGAGPLALSHLKGQGPAADYGLKPTWQDVKVGLACGGLSLLLAWIVGVVLLSIRRDTASSTSALEDIGLLSGGKSVWLAVAALFVFLGAPFTEELLTRGALWNALEHHRIPRLTILALTALIFAFLHEESWRTIGLFAQGMAIGTARMITGRTSSSIVAHATNNLLPAVYLYVGAS
ncbi:CPBP family intramembrane glutamic endopeptidase [Umezawaea sp. Da 62-37]|uniref:CPBP family intramembrane glutamic endopeptidase n=1 Tax=Umezawaea sp. Da 62-37 TaxID=3075927 RepID=UPI0028F6D8FA|nr:CPBP family intramembrane glutamic endopeptidase [Umezawaea sp. Da 62-37]WNV89892.1 CPBP family intramembrane glutamic endopeptidase [Umezawaea sp. Da 62-37]